MGYVSRLHRHFRLILIDARGHGASDKPHDPAAYRVQTMVDDVVAVLDHLRVDQTRFCGSSSGTWFGFGLADLNHFQAHLAVDVAAPLIIEHVATKSVATASVQPKPNDRSIKYPEA